MNAALTFQPPPIADINYSPGSGDDTFRIQLPLVTEETGTKPIKYTLSPVLATELTFSTSAETNEITVTPTAEEKTRTYTYTAEDQNGALAAQIFTLTIKALELPNIPDKTYFFGSEINEELPPATGGTGMIMYDLLPEPPFPLSFDRGTRVISGTVPGTVPEDRQKERYDYVAQDETGTKSTQTFTITISPIPDPIGLNVQPSPLNIIVGMNGQLTVGVEVSEDTDVTLTVTVDSRGENIITGLAEEYLLSDETSTEITVQGVVIGDTTLTITVAAEDYITETTLVSVVVLDLLRIKAEPAKLSLVEMAGGDSTQISVSLNRIEGDEVTVNIAAITGLSVMPSPLRFNRMESQTVTVTATNDNEYIGDRSVTLTLTATAYTTAMVTVEITEDELQPIILEGVPTGLRLMRFASTEIEVSVNVTAALTVKAEGAVSLANNNTLISSDLGEMESTRIEILGVSEGDGTVTFIASGDRKATDTVVVNVTVTQPILVISDVSALAINLAARTTAGLTVRVSAVGDHRSTLTATVSDEASDVASVTPTKMTNVQAGTTVTFIVEGLDEGDTTIRLMASRPDYESTSTEVAVRVYLPPVRLSVPTLLQLEQRATGLLTIVVRDSTQATITIRSDNANIASVSSRAFTLMGGKSNNSTNVVVSGNDMIGVTTLTITATADGYSTGTATVIVEVLDLFRIVAPARFDLAERSTSAISVSLSRIRADRDTVMVTIKPEGSGLTVSESSLTFSSSSPEPQFITVETTTDNTYTGDRSRTLTLTADDYTTATVTVDIIENTPQPIELRVRGSTDLSLVRFTSTMIEVSVGVNATLNVGTEGAVILVDAQSEYSLTGDADATQIQIRGDSVGDGTVTFMVSGDRKATDTVVVSVDVTKPTLVISDVSARAIDLAAQTTAGLTVRVSAVGGHNSTLTATVTETGVALVTPMKIPNEVAADTTVMFTVKGLAAGTAVLTLTADHPDYDSTSTTVDVSVYLRQFELSVEPSPLKVVIGMPEQLTVEVSADTDVTDVTLTVTVDGVVGESIIEGFAAEYLLMSGETSTEITVRGVVIGTTALTIAASAVGYETETTSVSVVVLDLLRIKAEPASLSLVEMVGGDSTQISVSLNRIEVDEVTVNIAATTGLSVMPSLLRFSATNLQTVTVTAINDDDYIGDRSVTLTLTATAYTTATVTVEITEDELQPIILEGVPTGLRLMRFASTEIEVSVNVTAALTVKAEGAVILVRLTDGSTLVSSDLGEMESIRIKIFGISEGEGTVTFTASGDKKATDTVVVNVDVTRPILVITEVRPPVINNLVVGDSTDCDSVQCSREVVNFLHW